MCATREKNQNFVQHDRHNNFATVMYQFYNYSRCDKWQMTNEFTEKSESLHEILKQTETLCPQSDFQSASVL